MNRTLTRTLPLAVGLMGLALTVHAEPKAKPAAAAQKPAAATAVAAETTPEYSIGLSVGESLKRSGADHLNMAAFMKGVQDGTGGKVTSAEDRERISKYMTELRNAGAAKNRQIGKDFLAKNAKNDDVVETASGLQYKIVDAGQKDAASPQASDKVTVHYTGRLIDGTVFDSSRDRGQPATFPVGGVIKGWQEALQLMKPGAKWQLFIPAELAYGDSAQGKITPGSVLLFDVELLSIGDAK